MVRLMPNKVYWTILTVTDVKISGLFKIVDISQRLTIVFDPILIVQGNSQLRELAFSRLK
ncbi:hypothetical protein RvY_12530 [Ramazzottius varieornatus]|uniref:Uncharacterized protein n=1 Tax=Ramazzottius varieornatus TaxID=947166 RepID=A0A1D1VLS1_RAMVA|nr:hypothetical protein RvY_12530 [Ramazzottius varieornatus]